MKIERLFDSDNHATDPDALYSDITWPEPPSDRPYVYINMASTVDGKIVLGSPTGPAKGVGGPTDQILFRRLQRQCDGALVGGTTLRASQVIYPPELPRFTVTHSSNLPLDNRFFTDAPGRAFVFAPESLAADKALKIETAAKLIRVGKTEVDLAEALKTMRRELSIRTLLCEGGPTINEQLFRAGLVDELFLTLAPKIKGGAALPTIVTGEGFAPGSYAPVKLISLYRDGDELYLRYGINQAPVQLPPP